MRFAWNMVTDVWNDFYCKILFELMPMEKNSHSITWSLSISDAFEMEAHWDLLSDWHLIMQTESALHFIVLHFERYWVLKFYWILFKKKCGSYASIGHRAAATDGFFPTKNQWHCFLHFWIALIKIDEKKSWELSICVPLSFTFIGVGSNEKIMKPMSYSESMV